MSYVVFIERRAQRALGRIAQPQRERIIGVIEQLGNEPRPPGVKQLSGREAWRVRAGDYRILYEIHDDKLVVLVIDVGHRRDIYR